MQIEFKAGIKLKAIHLDNALKLIATIKNWNETMNIRLKTIIPYMSNQNGITKHSIQTTKTNIQTMLKSAIQSTTF